jgi:hypothetical protein
MDNSSTFNIRNDQLLLINILNTMYNDNLQQINNESSSKLAFYVSIELELFPGKSANVLQRSVVRCQSTFERIREAYAEIFGYQYRPKPHVYNISDTEKTVKNKTETNKPETNKIGGFNKTIKIKRV